MNNIKVYKKITIITLVILIAFSSAAAAVEIEKVSLTEALEIAFKGSSDLRNQLNQIEDLERELKIIDAQEDWQLNLDLYYDYLVNEGDTSKSSEAIAFDSNSLISENAGEADLSISKTYSSGLYISQYLVYNQDGESDYQFSLDYPIFPGVPTDLQQEYYSNSESLLQLKADYSSLKESKLSEWLDSYFEILRLNESQKKAELNLEILSRELAERKAEAEIKEAGKEELLTAEINYLEAEKSLKEISDNLNTALDSLRIVLSLTENMELKLDRENKFLNELRASLKKYQTIKQNDVYQEVLKNDYEIKSAEINLKLKEKELEWLQDEVNSSLDLIAAYNNATENAVIGLAYNYDFYDGGEKEFNIETKEEDIKLLKKDLNELKQSKNNYLVNLINTVETSQQEVEIAELSLEKSKYSLKIAEKQLAEGLITETDYLDYQSEYQQAEINRLEAEDDLFLAEVTLNLFIENNLIKVEMED